MNKTTDSSLSERELLAFVKLVRQHYREAKIKLTPEIVERMDEIVGEHTVGQQSNPATLREAIERVELMADDDSNWDLSPNDRAALQTLLTALAASGTEAAPVTCESCKSTNTQRYENAGGLKMYSCTDCGWHHEAPAQAAASPDEGEGRKTDLRQHIANLLKVYRTALRFIKTCHEQKAWPKELPITEENSNVIERAEAALRQSAAPSGGDLREKVRKWREDALNESKSDNEWDATAARGRFYAYDNVWAALAQESKTGAVTETK